MLQKQNFNNYFSYSERMELMEKYKDYKLEYNFYNGKVSKSAIQIAKTMKIKLNLDLLPIVRKIACKGFDISSGTFAFSMLDKSGKEFFFTSSAKNYKSKKNEYEINGNEIIV